MAAARRPQCDSTMVPHGSLALCLAFLSWAPFAVLGSPAPESSIPLTGQTIPLTRRTSSPILDADQRGLLAKAQRDLVIARYFGGTAEVRRSSGSNLCVYIILCTRWRARRRCCETANTSRAESSTNCPTRSVYALSYLRSACSCLPQLLWHAGHRDTARLVQRPA